MWHLEKDLGETSIKVITHTWEIGELASVKRKLWRVGEKKKKQARKELGGIPSLRGQKEKEK